ncbi:MAG: DNA helicase PcrA [Peptococcaceae bacterium]|nr:DNA helicase PcrA [Peptococcaceae bacterium]
MDLSQLNMPQREAVECTEGPLLILAGAGSGKTRVLTTRIAYLIYEKRVAPWNILAITFTNKAAQEMRERIVALVGQDGEKVWASTFHSTCVRILRNEINYIGYDTSFVIYDDADQQTLIKMILKEQNLDEKKFPPRGVAARISTHKNELRTPEMAYREAMGDFAEEKHAEIYRMYQERLKQNNALDFDDLIMLTVQLFRDYPEVLERYQERFRYILVDEYQDTNMAQYVLVKLLASRYENLCVVGDDDQSIYQWRGADIRNILNFEKDYPNARVVKLEENYRSTQCILDAAYSVVRHNEGRKDKRLWTEKKEGSLIASYMAYTEREEAWFIAKQIRDGVKEGRKLKDFAILCRATAQFRVLEETFIKEAIPYHIYGGQKFYGRKEIKDIMAYLRIIANPADVISAERALATPKRGVGDTSWMKLVQFAQENNLTISDALLRAEESTVGKKYAMIMAQFGRLLDTFRILSESLPVTALTQMILEESGYLQALQAEKTVEAESRIENLNEFISITTAFDSREDAENLNLSAFLAEVALFTDLDQMDTAEDSVTIMTMHGAKGLEFPVVFVTGMEEGVFPHSRAAYSLEPGEMEEERRLCYVALTRAKEQVYLTRAGERMLYGRTNYNAPSRFLKEMPAHLVWDMNRETKKRHAEERKPAASAGRSGADFFGSQAVKAAGKPDGGTAGSAAGNAEYQINDTIEHKKWGQGVVVGVSGSGDDLSIRVIFPEMGMKDLFVKYAPIRKV